MTCSECNSEIPNEKETHMENGDVLCPKCLLSESEDEVKKITSSICSGQCREEEEFREIEFIIQRNVRVL